VTRAGLLCTLALALACVGPGISRVKPQLEPPAETLDFGALPVLNVKTLQIPLVNQGRAALTVSNVALSTTDGVFAITQAPAQVGTGDTENLVVRFSPPLEQAYAATLTFDTDDTDAPHVSIALTGSGSTRAKLSFAPATLDFGRAPECGSTVQQLVLSSIGSADLQVTTIEFTHDTPAAFAFVGSTRTPATVKTGSSTGLTLTVKLSVPQGTTGPLTGGLHLVTTDPDQRDVVIPLQATINRAPVPVIGSFGNGAPGLTVTLDGSGTSDPDGDTPLTYQWTLRSKPLSSTTTIAAPTQVSTAMTLDPSMPGAYEVQLEATDATGVKSCAPVRATVVAAPAQKLLVELYWDNAVTDLDLHVLRTPTSTLGQSPDDCFFQNRAPDWGVMGDSSDDPLLSRDALVGYGPEVFGYVNPVAGTYRVAVQLASTHLSTTPASAATVRFYVYGVEQAELKKTLSTEGEVWNVADLSWPSGAIQALP
jgi:hypothetical protein